MTTRHEATTFEAERDAWRMYRASILRDYNERRAESGHSTGSYVEPSPRSRERGAAWLAAYREREVHCRRRKGS